MDPDDAISLLRRANERGDAFFDTAESYGQGSNETLVGRALEPIRDDVFIATKFGFVNGRPADGLDSRPERIRQVTDGSLQRLRTDRIDLLYQHHVDPSVPIEEVAGTVRDLIAEGKVGHFGLSEAGVRHDPSSPRRPARGPPCRTSTRSGGVSPKTKNVPPSTNSASALVAFSPLGKGFLTGTITADTKFGEGDTRASGTAFPRFSKGPTRQRSACRGDPAVRHAAPTPPRPRSLWRGSSPSAPRSCRSPAPSRAPSHRREPRRHHDHPARRRPGPTR